MDSAQPPQSPENKGRRHPVCFSIK